jgi:aryl-alcohol dehydrogenase-like predicted oxidoreductase
MADDDWRRRGREFQQPNLSRNIALRDALRPIAARYGVSVASIAIAWTLSWPGVSGAIVGARTPAQVDGWIQAASLQLAQSDLSEIAAAIEKTEAGAGPSLPTKTSASTGKSAS